ncbi:MAG: hypothetical protein J2P23_02905 [Microlunatus sp.]|nr:hypothetical protein [Microlunatus sp.]
MVQYWLPIANVLSATVMIVCYVVALLLIRGLAEGRARILGVAGVIVLFVATALGSLNGSLGLWMTNAPGSHVDVYGLASIAVACFGAAGLVLLVLAVVAARKATRSRGGH